MPLSTSNSNDRLPVLPWGRIWRLTIILAIVCLGSYEMLWRWQGFVPSPRDDAGLWMLQRNKLQPHDREQVVLLGASQTQSNYDLDTFERLYGSRPVQLAVFSSSCLPTLDQLANDVNFRGIIVADVIDYAFYNGMYPSQMDERQQRYVSKYEQRSAGWKLEEELSTWINMHVTFRQDALRLGHVLKCLAVGRWPDFPRSRASRDREEKYDFPKKEMIAISIANDPQENLHPADSAHFYRDLPKLRARVERITERGGKVVFVAMPMTGYVRDVTLKRFPREQFFDQLIIGSGATAGIFFMDYAELRDLVPPDGSHLDQSDMVRFTEILVGILKEKLQGN